jgi:hypothetical protein
MNRNNRAREDAPPCAGQDKGTESGLGGPGSDERPKAARRKPKPA